MVEETSTSYVTPTTESSAGTCGTKNMLIGNIAKRFKYLTDSGIPIPLLEAITSALSIVSFKMIMIFFFFCDMRLFHLLSVFSFLFSIERPV